MDFLNDLNKQQKRAVEYNSGPALILAGAGSGKTRALTYRLAYLIKSGVQPQQILGVTFTNKAAEEMEERTAELLGSNRRLPFLGTFHSIACQILRKELDGLNLAIDSRFLIFDQNDSQGLIKQIIKDKNLDSKDKFNSRKVLGFISSCKQDRVGPDALPDDEYYLREIKPIYKNYQKRLTENNALDFDDLLIKLVEILEENENIRSKYQNNFKHILVDEYQDTNQIQYQMIKIFSEGSNNPNLVVVGDDWQSIYKFRGADYANILNFKNDYPKAKVFKLEQNFRSTKNIVGAAQALIKNNSSRSDKDLWTDNRLGSKISLIEADSGEDEAKKVAEIIEEKSSYSQTAVLYRTHAQSRLMEEALIYKRIPYQIIGGLRFYQRKEIKDLISYLFVAYGETNGYHLKRIINTPRRGIGKKTEVKLEESGWQLDKVESRAIREFETILNDLRKRAGEVAVDKLIGWLVKKIGYQQYLQDYSQTSEQAEYRWENVQELISVAGKFSDMEPDKSLGAFLEEASLMDFQDDLKDDARVTLMTLHNAKGLEYDNVFIVGLEKGLLPHSRSLEQMAELEEERRLCYVGMTRAKKNLHLSWAKSRYIYGQPQIQEQSEFISEIPDKFLNVIDQRGIGGSSYSSQDGSDSVDVDLDLKVGDWIEHLKLGKARVIGIDETMLEVKFKGIGKKILSLEYAPIKKIRE